MLDKVKRSFLFRRLALVAAGTALIAATYGLVRLAFGLHLPDMSADVGFDTATAGMISAAASLVYGGAALLGFALGATRPRLLVVLALLTAGGGAVGIALAPDVVVLAASATVSSAGAGLASPAMVRIVHAAFNGHDFDSAQAIVNAGTGPGLVVAGLIALALTPDWRVAWLIAAAATLGAGLAVLALARPADASTTPARRLPPMPWWRGHRRPVAAAALFGIGAAAVWNYGRVVMVDAGASPSASVLAWVWVGCGGAAVIATAPLTRRTPPGRMWLISTAIAAGGTAALGAFPGEPVAAAAACALFGWGYVAASGALIGWTTRIDADRAAAGTAALFVVFMIGQAVGATALGATLPVVGPLAAFVAAGALGVLAGLLAPRAHRAPARSVA